MKLYSALYNDHYPLSLWFRDAQQVVVSEPEELDAPGILILHGGADISPSLYNRAVSKETHAGPQPSRRDELEWALLQEAIKKNITVFGICRGAQMLCAAAGGYLIQDVTDHLGHHDIKTADGKVVKVNSIHHQMMAPWEVDHKLLAWSKARRSRHYIDEHRSVEVPCEPEAVFYPKIKGFAIQWHPEGMDANSPASKWVHQQLLSVLEKA